MRLRIACLIAPFLCALPAIGQEPFRPSTPPADSAGGWTAAPGTWKTIERADVASRNGTRWRLEVSERELGTIGGERAAVHLFLPRVAIRRIERRDSITAAILLPASNREIGVYPADSPEQDAEPHRIGRDELGRWPNACKISILDATGSLDLDGDGNPEVALRRFCSCPGAACAGIVLVELDPKGPATLDPASLVPDLHLGRLVLERILPGAEPSSPVLQVEPDLLEGCRLIALLDIRGSNECPDCCRFPVFLRRDAAGAYEPFYEAGAQSAWLDRAKGDIGAAAAGNPEQPLLSLEEAQVARAAAFFYLTGSGAQTREMVSKGLGIRGRSFRAQELLRKTEELFLGAAPGAR